MLQTFRHYYWSCPCVSYQKQRWNCHTSWPTYLQQFLSPTTTSFLTPKTRETALQILKRAMWTNKKAFKSCIWPDPNCEHWEWVETMEHLLCDCELYSELLRNRLGDVLMWYLSTRAADLVPRMELGQTNLIFNILHPSIQHHIQTKPTRNTLILLTQEIKRDIIYRQMNLPPPLHPTQQVTAPQQLAVHLNSTVLYSYLQYIGLVKYAKAIETCCNSKKSTLPDVTPHWTFMLLIPFMSWQFIPTTCQHYTDDALLSTLSISTQDYYK